MSDTLSPALRAIVASLGDAGRARLARRIGAALRAENARRIGEQKNPDGSRFEPRRPIAERFKAAQAKSRTRMFDKLRHRLRVLSATAAGVEVGFSGRDEQIARIHHYGLQDQVAPRLRIRYPIRQLLGITQGDRETIARTVLEHVGN